MSDGGILDYYRRHSALTDPGSRAGLLDALPDDVPSMVRAVLELVIHPVGATKVYRVRKPGYVSEPGLRLVSDILSALADLDRAPLAEPRDPSRRLVASCRTPAVLLVAMLRHKGIPARKRNGFARYFAVALPYIAHELAEHWDHARARWVMIDASADDRVAAVHRAWFERRGDAQRGVYDRLDVTPDQFVPAAEVWRACRTGQLDPAQLYSGWNLGLRSIAVSVLQDLDSLNGAELVSHDSSLVPYDLDSDQDLDPEHWVYPDRTELSAGELRFVDRAASLLTDVNANFPDMRALYERHRGPAIRALLRSLTAPPSQS